MRWKRGMATTIMTPSIVHRTMTATAVAVVHSQALPEILMTAHTARMGALTTACMPMAITPWIWVTSLVTRLIRLGAENRPTSASEKAREWSKISSRRERARPAAVRAAR